MEPGIKGGDSNSGVRIWSSEILERERRRREREGDERERRGRGRW